MSIRIRETSFLRWRQVVDQTLNANFAITIEDAGTSESVLEASWKSGQTPREYVSWFGKKYDLVHLDEWRTHAPLNTLSR